MAGSQDQDLAGLVAARMADERPFAGCAGRCPKDAIADAVFRRRLIVDDCRHSSRCLRTGAFDAKILGQSKTAQPNGEEEPASGCAAKRPVK